MPKPPIPDPGSDPGPGPGSNPSSLWLLVAVVLLVPLIFWAGYFRLLG